MQKKSQARFLCLRCMQQQPPLLSLGLPTSLGVRLYSFVLWLFVAAAAAFSALVMSCQRGGSEH